MKRATLKPPIDWLLAGEPYIQYRTRRDLLAEPEQAAAVKSARRAMLESAPVLGLVAEFQTWPGVVIASHKSAGQPFHKLTFLADIGLRAGDPGIEAVVSRILRHQSAEGPFQLRANVATAHGGTGKDLWAWALCDAPLIVYALVKFGEGRTPAVRAAMEHLLGLVRANGWPCVVSKELGTFRGPGRKDDPCPFASLAMLKALSLLEDATKGTAARAGTEALLSAWAASSQRHPYMFYMGTDFRKLKAPFIWYDLMHVLDVLSLFPQLRGDRRLLDMLGILTSKADEDGCFTPESVWTAWGDWEFGQKKAPSRWLTLLAWRIIGRVEAA
jgi:hypothetical protein